MYNTPGVKRTHRGDEKSGQNPFVVIGHHLLCDVMIPWKPPDCSGGAAQQQQNTVCGIDNTQVTGQLIVQTKHEWI